MLILLAIIGIIGIIISIGFSLADMDECCGFEWKSQKWICLWLVISLIVGGIGLGFYLKVKSKTYEEKSQSGTWEIVSMKNNENFYDPSATALVQKDGNYYTFYYKYGTDQIGYCSINMNDCTLHIQKNVTPHVDEYVTKSKNECLSNGWYGFLTFKKREETTSYRYDIFIPTQKELYEYEAKP